MEMKNFFKKIAVIIKEDRGILGYFLINFVVSLVVFVLGLVTLRPDSAVVKIAYGDIGGYSDGTWVDMLVFPIFGMIIGVLHSIIAVMIYHKNGKAAARVFFVISIATGVLATIVLCRLVWEG